MEFITKIKGKPTPATGGTGIRACALTAVGESTRDIFRSEVMQEEKKGEMVYLTEKSDVLNGFLSDHQIESELLCVEKLNFIISWGVMKKDLSMKIVRNSNVLEVPSTGLSFTSKDDLNDRVLP